MKPSEDDGDRAQCLSPQQMGVSKGSLSETPIVLKKMFYLQIFTTDSKFIVDFISAQS